MTDDNSSKFKTGDIAIIDAAFRTAFGRGTDWKADSGWRSYHTPIGGVVAAGVFEDWNQPGRWQVSVATDCGGIRLGEDLGFFDDIGRAAEVMVTLIRQAARQLAESVEPYC